MLQLKITAFPLERMLTINRLLRLLVPAGRAAIALGPFNTQLRLLQRIASKAQLCGEALLYPGGGYDAWTAFQLHPQAQSVITIGRESFGSVFEVQRCLEMMHRLACSGDTVFQKYAGKYNYDAENWFAKYNLNGGYALFKLATYKNWYPQTIETLDPAGLPVTKITMQNLQGESKYIWHVQMDLGYESNTLPAFLSMFSFGGMLLKAALDITNPQQEGAGFYKNILRYVRDNDIPIIMDRPLNQRRYTFFDPASVPLRVPLGSMDTFGYLKGLGDTVEIVQGSALLDFERFLTHERTLIPLR